jgi:hypothetical protein
MFSTSRLASIASQAAKRRAAALSATAVRSLNVHEYISMEIMKNHGIKTPECSVASTPEEAERIFLHGINKRKKQNMHTFILPFCYVLCVCVE